MMMFLGLILTFALGGGISSQPAAATPVLSGTELVQVAHKLASDEGWPIDQQGYTFDMMQPAVDDGFQSIGLYRNAHLLRMYSIHRQTGDIVDFMHGCDLLQFDNVKDLQKLIQKRSGSSSIPPDRLAAMVGCPKLNIVNSRWVNR